MFSKPIKVYIKINNNYEIIEINSSVFIENTKNYIEIDEGNGDKYAHAQNYYLEKPIIDESGNYNYKYHHGKIVDI